MERLVAYLIEKKPSDRPCSADRVCDAIALVRAGGMLDESQRAYMSAIDNMRRYDTPKPSWMHEDATTALLPASPLERFTL